MYSILQDVDNIMYNQLSDVFDLSQWVVNIVTLFDLRVCDAEEWKSFSNHYNHGTGKVSASKIPYESITAPHSTNMSEVDRDELSKAQVELTMANTTIKNLLEAVVNFSHTGNISN